MSGESAERRGNHGEARREVAKRRGVVDGRVKAKGNGGNCFVSKIKSYKYEMDSRIFCIFALRGTPRNKTTTLILNETAFS